MSTQSKSAQIEQNQTDEVSLLPPRVSSFYVYRDAPGQELVFFSPYLRTMKEAKNYPVTGDVTHAKCGGGTYFLDSDEEAKQIEEKWFGKEPEKDIQFFVVMQREGNFQDYIGPFYETEAQAQALLDSLECVNDKKTFVARGIRMHCENLSREEREILLSQLVRA